MSKMAAAEVCLDVVTPRYSIKALCSTMMKGAAKLHCRLMHKSVSRPVNGKYRCWSCLQEFDTTW